MVFGWDISTSAIGICIKDDSGKTLEFAVLFPQGKTHLEKHRDAATKVLSFVGSRINETAVHIVEERLGGFTGGLTTKQTLMALAAMNAVISYILSASGTVVHIPPITTKRIMGLNVPKGGNKKEEVIRLVRAQEPAFPYSETKSGNYVKGTDDMADAWLLAGAWVKVSKGEATIGQPKKASRNKSKVGAPKRI